MISTIKSGIGIYQVQITALNPRPINLQSSIFENVSNKQQKKIDKPWIVSTKDIPNK